VLLSRYFEVQLLPPLKMVIAESGVKTPKIRK
jgi:hypothetical protein